MQHSSFLGKAYYNRNQAVYLRKKTDTARTSTRVHIPVRQTAGRCRKRSTCPLSCRLVPPKHEICQPNSCARGQRAFVDMPTPSQEQSSSLDSLSLTHHRPALCSQCPDTSRICITRSLVVTACIFVFSLSRIYLYHRGRTWGGRASCGGSRSSREARDKDPCHDNAKDSVGNHVVNDRCN